MRRARDPVKLVRVGRRHTASDTRRSSSPPDAGVARNPTVNAELAEIARPFLGALANRTSRAKGLGHALPSQRWSSSARERGIEGRVVHTNKAPCSIRYIARCAGMFKFDCEYKHQPGRAALHHAIVRPDHGWTALLVDSQARRHHADLRAARPGTTGRRAPVAPRRTAPVRTPVARSIRRRRQG